MRPLIHLNMHGDTAAGLEIVALVCTTHLPSGAPGEHDPLIGGAEPAAASRKSKSTLSLSPSELRRAAMDPLPGEIAPAAVVNRLLQYVPRLVVLRPDPQVGLND